jgi:hypothetical protein
MSASPRIADIGGPSKGEPKMTDRAFGQLTRRLCDFSASTSDVDGP